MFTIHFIQFPLAHGWKSSTELVPTAELCPVSNWHQTQSSSLRYPEIPRPRCFRICCPVSSTCSFSDLIWCDGEPKSRFDRPASVILRIQARWRLSFGKLEEDSVATLMGLNWNCKHLQTYRSSQRPCITDIHRSWDDVNNPVH